MVLQRGLLKWDSAGRSSGGSGSDPALNRHCNLLYDGHQNERHLSKQQLRFRSSQDIRPSPFRQRHLLQQSYSTTDLLGQEKAGAVSCRGGGSLNTSPHRVNQVRCLYGYFLLFCVAHVPIRDFLLFWRSLSFIYFVQLDKFGFFAQSSFLPSQFPHLFS